MRRRNRHDDGADARAEAVAALLDQLPAVSPDQLVALGSVWRNTSVVARGRSRGLSPDTPGVLGLLDAFATVSAVFADDVAAAPDRTTAAAGVKAVRDALVAVGAAPVLGRVERRALAAPWARVHAGRAPAALDLGPHAPALRALLDGLARLGERCHDAAARARFDALADRLDDGDPERARREARRTAALTGRSRTAALLRRRSAAALRPHCGATRDLPGQRARVEARAADATAALLVADALPGPVAAALTAPLVPLVPRLGTVREA